MPVPPFIIEQLRPRAKAAFARRILPAMIALLTLALLVAAIAVVQIATRIDRDAVSQGRFLAGKVVEAQQRWMVRSIVDYAFWGEAYANLSATTNLEWAYERANFGPSLFRDYGYEGALLVNATGATTYAVMRGELRADVQAHQWLQGGLDTLIAAARKAVEQDKGVVGLLSAEGRPALVAAAVMTPGSTDIEEHAGPAAVLLFVDVLDDQRLLELGREYGLESLRLVPAGSSASPSLDLELEDGTAVALTWTAPTPGYYLLWSTLPILAAVAGGLGLLAWLLMRQALRTIKMLDASYARLANSRAALASSEERFRDVAEAASDWIWEADSHTCLTYLSSRFESITGHTQQAWLGQPLIELLVCDSAAIQEWLAAPGEKSLKCSYHAADGRERHCRLAARAIRRDGQLLGYRGTATDITEETRAQARIQYLSQHDALTGLPNRARLRDYLEAKLDSMGHRESHLTLLYIDLDRFKPVNDTYGHAAGDEVLIGVSHRLKQCTRGEDLVARLGGDEFVMVVPRMRNRDDIEKLCRRVVTTLCEPFLHGEKEISIGASVGVAIAPIDALHANELLRCADVALYQAKAAGRATWCFFEKEMDCRLHERHTQEDELRQAIAQGQFLLHYQPRYLSNGQHIVGAEALLRWQHPERGLLLPEQFIPLTEETGLIVPLGNWVLRQACTDAANWPDALAISVNLSPVQLRNPRLADEVQALLEETGLAAERLELEIHEGALLQENDGVLALLTQLKALGVQLTMDNFGIGYSSLSNLRNYPFDIVKIDGSFFQGAPQSDDEQPIIYVLSQLGRGLRKQVSIEGVETPEQLEMVCKAGCTQVQGFHLSHPLPLDALQALFRRSAAPRIGVAHGGAEILEGRDQAFSV